MRPIVAKVDADIIDAVPVVAEDEVADTEANSFASGNVVESVKGLNNPDEAGYSSIVATTFEEKLDILDAMNNSTPLDEVLNVPFKLKHIIVTVVHLANQQTGIVAPQPRIVLIDEDGVARHATSTGLMQSITTLLKVAGEPNKWANPINVKVVKEGSGTNKYFTLKLVR